MKSPHMAAITDSLEQSFRAFSINHRLASASGAAAAAAAAPSVGVRRSPSSSSDDEQRRHHHPHHRFDTTLELNSHISLPPFWEQCLDLKTGEVYYRNCRTGMRVKEDPRITEAHSRDSYSDDEDDDGDESSSDGGSEESCCSSPYDGGGGGGGRQQYPAENEEEVLVVAGCKRCFMYFMVPKQVEDCPKCSTSRLVHFDRSDDSNGFP